MMSLPLPCNFCSPCSHFFIAFANNWQTALWNHCRYLQNQSKKRITVTVNDCNEDNNDCMKATMTAWRQQCNEGNHDCMKATMTAWRQQWLQWTIIITTMVPEILKKDTVYASTECSCRCFWRDDTMMKLSTRNMPWDTQLARTNPTWSPDGQCPTQ